jgi:hypothetical protein
MVHCSNCHVENVHASCGNTPKLCYTCCIKPGVATCVFHYNSMPILERQARADTLAAAVAAGALPAGSPPPSAHAASASVPVIAHNGGPAPASDQHSAALPVVPDSSLATLTLLLTALTTRLSAIEGRLPAISPASVAAPSPASSLPLPISPPAALSPPASVHRQAVLDPSLSAVALTNLYNSLEVDSDDDDGAQERKTDVSTQLTHSTLTLDNVFPPSLAAAPIGSAEDGQQQLARLLSAFHKTSSTVKYATLADLSEAINDWYTAASKAKWPHDRLKSIYDYRSFVIDDIGRQSSLTHAVKYHTLFAKAVQNGEHSLFTPRGFFDPLSYIKVFPHSTTSTPTSASKGDKKPPKDKKKGGATGKDKTFAAGSCTNHPLSTTHDTSMCNKK